jgi:hypothetical protein
MQQVHCPDGQWRWVSTEAARRLDQAEPRESLPLRVVEPPALIHIEPEEPGGE